MSQDNQHQPLDFQAPSLEKLADLLPQYSFDSLIAKGGMGAVYKATQTSLDRPVAIKVLPIEISSEESFRESFKTEAKLMAKLNHPNLIGIYDFGEIDGMLYIVMELVEGKSLYEKTYGKAIKQESALRLVRDICLGLENAHSAGILHRDIKPANIILKDKQPKIGDFGLARPAGNAETGIIFGTPGYTAPEVLTHPEAVDQRTDLYSVGIILYELITGEKPGTNYIPVNNLVDCDPKIDQIIRKAIQTDLTKRYPDAAVMAEEIDDLIRALKPAATAPTNAGNKLITSPSSSATIRTGTTPTTIRTGAKPTTNPVAVRPSTKSSTAPVAVKPAAVKPTPVAAKLATPAVQAAAPPEPTGEPIKVNTSGDNIVARNIVIILILLVAIYVAHSMLTQKQKDTAEADAQARAEQLERKKEKEALAAAKKEEIRLAQEEYNRNPNQKPQRPIPDELTQEPKKSSAEILEQLRTQLLAGQRPEEQMPEGTFTLTGNTRMLLVVDTPMNWHQADRFARQHGAYLATLRNTSDTTAILSKIPSGKSVWLGAGTSGSKKWSWSDGTPAAEALDLGRNSKHRFIKLGEDAYPEPTEPLEEHPFVLEWRMDGTNPGTIRERLLLTRQTLSQIDAIYPAGTMSFGSRNFLLVPADTTHKQARELAEIGGARLYVPSDQQEIDFIAAALPKTLPDGQKAWIGGFKKDKIWTWLSGEPWEIAHWDQNHPQDNNALAITSKPSAPWQDTPSSDILPFALLEWSQDKADVSTDTLQNDGNASNASLAKLIAKAKTLTSTQNTKREEDHAENLKRLVWDIDFYYKGLTKGDKAAQFDAIEELKAMVDGKDRVPLTMSNLGPSAKVQSITTYAVNKQAQIEKAFQENIEKIRIAYIGQLEALAEELRKKGQISAQNEVLTEIKNSGKTPEGFIQHFGL